jgi:tRNA-splicing ligase RtcB
MKLRHVEGDLWEIPREGRMRVAGRIWSAGPPAPDDGALLQLANVACLPGILRFALAMPDYHPGYGFPIGGVAAVDADEGAVSPGGVGYDINCGVRVVTTGLDAETLRPRLHAAVTALYQAIPAGMGQGGAVPRLTDRDLEAVLTGGVGWAVRRGFAAAGDDAERCEEGGRLAGADPEAVSRRARQRGADQLGTLGSGNHFIELDRVAEILDPVAADAFGLLPGALVLQVHSGSRGLGHQVCQDFVQELGRAPARFGPGYADLPDPQLAAAPVRSEEGRRYLGAMAAAANFAWANRQVMTGLALRALAGALGASERDLGARLLYDVCHNIAKWEDHEIRVGPVASWSTARGRRGPSGRATRGCRRPIARRASRSSSRATWGGPPGCWPAPPAPWPRPSAPPATGRGAASRAPRPSSGPRGATSPASSRLGASR